jgi:hypothetical protein
MSNAPTDDPNSSEFWNKKAKEFFEIQALADEFGGEQTAVEIKYIHKSKGQPECWLLLGGGPVVPLRLARLINECLQKLGKPVADQPWEVWARMLASDSAIHLVLPISANGKKIGRSYAKGAFERFIREHLFKVITDSVLFCRLQAENATHEGALSPVASPTLLADTVAGVAAERNPRPPRGRGQRVPNLKRYRLAAGLSQADLANMTLTTAPETISRLERGTQNASARTLGNLKDALNKKLSQKIDISDLCAEPT